jgi:hypothetical protein
MSKDLTEIQAMLDRLTQLGEEYAQEKAIADDIKDDIDLLRHDILLAMVDNKLKSLKNDRLQVSVKSVPTVAISDQRAVIEWLDENPDYDPADYIRLDKRMVDPIIKNTLKTDGEVVPGTEITTVETIAVSQLKGTPHE